MDSLKPKPPNKRHTLLALIMLTHICHIAIDATTYCASAQLSERHHFRDKRQWQRKGVRILLQKLLITLGIVDILDDSQFPYRLINSRYYVCFSHSNNTVAVIVNTQRSIGIDIEIQNIEWQVAERFYHPEEITILSTLPLEQRGIIAKWLWQIKESFIKVNQHTLAQGLGINYVSTIPALFSIVTDTTNTPINISDSKRTHNYHHIMINHDADSQNHLRKDDEYHIMIVPHQQLVIVF